MGEDQTLGDWGKKAGQFVRNNDTVIAASAGTYKIAKTLGYMKPQYTAGMLIGYAIYDPFSPAWNVQSTLINEDRFQLDLRMRPFITGGEGEARQVFMRSARIMVEQGGYSGFDILRYEEGIEPSRPFARRVASGEIRLVRSYQFYDLK